MPSEFPGLDVIPADFSYRNFDTLFLDCPPGISLRSESVFRAADALVYEALWLEIEARI